MSDNKKRVAIKCHGCGRDFSILREFDGKPRFALPCPFCGATNVVDLAPWRSRVRDIHAGEGEPLTLDVLDLPDVLPGRAPEPGEEMP
jgi:transposase-like protein